MLRVTGTASTEDDLRAALEAWLRQDPSVRSRVLLDVADAIRHEHAASDVDADVAREPAPADAVSTTRDHASSYSRSRRIGSNVLIAGARVCGRAQAADRRGSTSWFDVVHADGWTAVVLAEGASSRPLSSLGARAATEAAIATLQQVPPLPRADGPGAIPVMRRAIRDAFAAASRAVLDAYRTCASDHAYTRQLGRSPVSADLACSCLVALHHTIDAARGQALVVASHAGRGMTGCIDTAGRPVMLGRGAASELDGVTLPLDEAALFEALAQRTIECSGEISTVIVAGRRIAESYALDERHLERLEADLILNGILPVPHIGSASIDTALSTVNLASLAALPLRADESLRWKSSAAERDASVRSAVACARSFGIDWRELRREPLLLAAGRVNTDSSVPIDVRLRHWLESVQLDDDVDDRTIVVWHREPA